MEQLFKDTKFESDVVLGSSLTIHLSISSYWKFESDVVLGSSLTCKTTA